MLKELFEGIRDNIVLPILAFAMIGLVAITLLWCLVTPFSFMNHASNRADLSQVDKIITIYEEEYSKTLSDILGIKEGISFRFNSDTPIKSVIDNRVRISEKLIESKIAKNKILAKILTRCNGPFALTVSFFDSVTCDAYRRM